MVYGTFSGNSGLCLELIGNGKFMNLRRNTGKKNNKKLQLENGRKRIVQRNKIQAEEGSHFYLKPV